MPVLDPPVLAATEYLTVPMPVPLAPEVMVIHELLLTAVHGQAEVVLTFTVPVPPTAPKDSLIGEIEYTQGTETYW